MCQSPCDRDVMTVHGGGRSVSRGLIVSLTDGVTRPLSRAVTDRHGRTAVPTGHGRHGGFEDHDDA